MFRVSEGMSDPVLEGHQEQFFTSAMGNVGCSDTRREPGILMLQLPEPGDYDSFMPNGEKERKTRS